ncbi:uncharacterized protein LOC112348942 [Selaginella moellendorffii]|uniref:uncharacterized protein LOC112348942 n=1 Tax=Selaginella moellendorffii TaxID=88036 RepID=UPI000D1C9F18|nr:uncharacterized protein LOC112348942 [Selaginella moellendorffii]|eukprot:XP_024538135.1 uncharacterized protein LOC112348942 [Selaginella moellendorffii]
MEERRVLPLRRRGPVPPREDPVPGWPDVLPRSPPQKLHLHDLHGVLLSKWSSTSSAASSYPRLDELCPAEDLQLETWQDFGQLFDRWLSLHWDDSLPAPGKRAAADPPIAGNPHWELALAMKPFLCDELPRGPRGPTIGRAEMCTISERREMMFLGVITLDGIESSSSKLVYARLWVYMVLNQVSIGMVAFAEHLAFCFRIDDGLKVHVASKDDPTSLLALGYAMHLGRLSPSPSSGVSPTRTFSFDGTRLLNHRFMAACKEMGLGRLDKVESMLRGIDERELVEVTRLVSQSASVVRAKYRAKTVALKIMDLTCWRSDFETYLKSTLTEIKVYQRLHKYQGRCIPHLYSYGFFGGGMFLYTMMSDFRTGDLDIPLTSEQYQALVSGAREALQAMHDRGILHGGIDNKSIVVSSLERSGAYAGYLLGFGHAEFVPQSGNYKRQMAEEWLRLEDSLAVYAPR